MQNSVARRACGGETAQSASNVTPLTSNRLSSAALRVLDNYAERVLTCPPAVARGGGVHILPTPQRGLPTWHGYVLPIVGIAFAPGAVVACRPDLVEQLRRELGSDVRLPYLDGPALRRLARATQHTLPHAFTLAGDLRAVDRSTFAPSATGDRAELIGDE